MFLYSGIFLMKGVNEYTGKLTQYEKNIPVTIQKEVDFIRINVGSLFSKSL